jgi:hypothetical protein
MSLLRVVGEKPGIHFRGLGREANVSSAGQLRHHLDRLQRQGILIEVEDGRYKRFFVAGDHDPNLRPVVARFARPVPRRIASLLLANAMNRTELRRSLGCADSTLGYHLTRMVSLRDLQKNRGPNCCHYSLTDPDLVRQILRAPNPAATPGRPAARPTPDAKAEGSRDTGTPRQWLVAGAARNASQDRLSAAQPQADPGRTPEAAAPAQSPAGGLQKGPE